MNLSKRQLYAVGETLGECVTRREAGRIIYGGGGGSSKSSSTTNTTVTDKRMVVDGGWGITADGSTVGLSSTNNTSTSVSNSGNTSTSTYFKDTGNTTNNITTIDAGVVKAALDFATGADAVAGDGYEKLLDTTKDVTVSGSNAFNRVIDLADKLFSTSSGILGKTADATLAQVSALNTAQNDDKGAIDQKTIIVLGIAGAVALVAVSGGFK